MIYIYSLKLLSFSLPFDVLRIFAHNIGVNVSEIIVEKNTAPIMVIASS